MIVMRLSWGRWILHPLWLLGQTEHSNSGVLPRYP
jgi:hypothetical protein